MDKWIKCSDRLPENQDLDEGDNDYCFVYYDDLSTYGTAKAMYCNGEWYTSYISKLIYPVTHWQPLPEFPTE